MDMETIRTIRTKRVDTHHKNLDRRFNIFEPNKIAIFLIHAARLLSKAWQASAFQPFE